MKNERFTICTVTAAFQHQRIHKYNKTRLGIQRVEIVEQLRNLDLSSTAKNFRLAFFVGVLLFCYIFDYFLGVPFEWILTFAASLAFIFLIGDTWLNRLQILILWLVVDVILYFLLDFPSVIHWVAITLFYMVILMIGNISVIKISKKNKTTTTF